MSIKAMNWCRDLKGVRGPKKGVLYSICDRYNDNYGYAWPSIRRIAEDSGYAERTVTTAVRWLESNNFIATHRQFYARDGSPASNRYYIPALSNTPAPGTVFEVGGDFDHDGKWDPSLEPD